MSHIAFDFLSDSLLFDQVHIATKYADVSDAELWTELEKYRAHVLARVDDFLAETAGVEGILSVYFDTSSRALPTVALLKQCALYFDRAVVDDPIFPLTRRSTPSAAAIGEYLGISAPKLSRDGLSSSAAFMRSVRSMTAGQFLKFVPISAVLEPPDKTPITYSATLYAERIPIELREWIRQRARITTLRRSDRNGWYWRPGDALEVGRAICVDFEDYGRPFLYFLFAPKFESHADDPNQFTVIQWMPESPPPSEQFEAWVQQSVNQAGGDILGHLQVDLVHAAHSRSMFLTESAFLADLLRLRSGPTLSEDVAQFALQLDLPVLAGISVEDLMKVRNEYGEAFHAFRLTLQRHLRELRTLQDASVIEKKLQNLQHELEEVQVADVERETRRVQREVLRNLVIGAVSLAAAVPTTGWSLTGLVPAAAAAYRARTGYGDRMKEHPAFFLWKLKDRASSR